MHWPVELLQGASITAKRSSLLWLQDTQTSRKLCTYGFSHRKSRRITCLFFVLSTYESLEYVYRKRLFKWCWMVWLIIVAASLKLMPACTEKKKAQKHPLAQLLPLTFPHDQEEVCQPCNNTDGVYTLRMWPILPAARAYLQRSYLTSTTALEAHHWPARLCNQYSADYWWQLPNRVNIYFCIILSCIIQGTQAPDSGIWIPLHRLKTEHHQALKSFAGSRYEMLSRE